MVFGLTELLLSCLLFTTSAVAGLMVGRTHGRDRAGMALGMLLGPLGVLIAALLPRPSTPVDAPAIYTRSSMGDRER